MSDSIVNLIHRASLTWPSQAVAFPNDEYDYTTAIQLEATNLRFVSLSKQVQMISEPVNLDPERIWIRISQVANALDGVDDMCKAFNTTRGLAFFSFSVNYLNLGHKDRSRDAALDRLVLNTPPAHGINTFLTSRHNVVVVPTEQMSSSASLMLESTAANNCWNRLHSIIENMGLTNSDLYGKKVSAAQFFSSSCRELGFTSGSDYSPLPGLLFGANKVMQGQYKIGSILVNYARFLKLKREHPFLMIVSAYPLKIESSCTAGMLGEEMNIQPAESVGVYVSDNAYANKVVSWMYALGMVTNVPLGRACRLGRKGYAQLNSAT